MNPELSPVDRGGDIDLNVGALVVHGGHGLGRITARHAKKGNDAKGATVVLEFPSGLSVTLPLERARASLRPPADATEIEALSVALRSQCGQRTSEVQAQIANGPH